MSWQDILKKISIPKETEGNYRGKEPATAEGRYGTKVTPEDIEREMEERRKEYEEEGIPEMPLEYKILREIEKEGGALGMKNLKQFADEDKLREALSSMEKEGKIFMHKDGDIYTHEPK